MPFLQFERPIFFARFYNFDFFSFDSDLKRSDLQDGTFSRFYLYKKIVKNKPFANMFPFTVSATLFWFK